MSGNHKPPGHQRISVKPICSISRRIELDVVYNSLQGGGSLCISAGKYVATVAPHIESGIPFSYYPVRRAAFPHSGVFGLSSEGHRTAAGG